MVGVLVIFNLLVAGSEDLEAYQIYPHGSTYSDSALGMELLYKLFQRVGFEVYQSRRPLEEYFMNEIKPDEIWHFSSTIVTATEEEIDWVDNWVAAGGVLVLISNPEMQSQEVLRGDRNHIFDLLEAHWMHRLGLVEKTSKIVQISDYGGKVKKRRLLVDASGMPSPFGEIGIINTYEKKTITGPVAFRFIWDGKGGFNDPAVIRDSHGIVVARGTYGKGEVWMISDPYLFSNILLQEGNNSLLAVSIGLRARKGGKSKIVFDEYHLGFVQTRTISDAAATPLGRAVIYIGCITVLAIGTAGARFGRVRRGQQTLGVSQRAYVKALAGMWEAAGATSAAADALWRRYHSRLGLRRNELLNVLEKFRIRVEKNEELLEIVKKLDKR